MQSRNCHFKSRAAGSLNDMPLSSVKWHIVSGIRQLAARIVAPTPRRVARPQNEQFARAWSPARSRAAKAGPCRGRPGWADHSSALPRPQTEACLASQASPHGSMYMAAALSRKWQATSTICRLVLEGGHSLKDTATFKQTRVAIHSSNRPLLFKSRESFFPGRATRRGVGATGGAGCKLADARDNVPLYT